MIFAYRTDDTIYFAYNASHFNPMSTNPSIINNADNLPFFLIKNNPHTIVLGQSFQREIDVLRYEQLIPGKLTKTNVIKHTLTLMHKKLTRYGLIDKDGEFSNIYLFAQNTSLLKLSYDKKITAIERFYSCSHSDIVAGCLALAKDLNPLDTIRYVFDTVCDYTQDLAYPIVVIDTKSEQIQYLRKEGTYANKPGNES